MVFVSMGGYALVLIWGRVLLSDARSVLRQRIWAFDETARIQRIHTLIRSYTTMVAVLALFVFLIGVSGGWSFLSTVVRRRSSVARSACVKDICRRRSANSSWRDMVCQHLWIRACLQGKGRSLFQHHVRPNIFECRFFHSFVSISIAYLLQTICTSLMARYVLYRSGMKRVAKGKFEISAIRLIVGPSLKYAATLLGGILILQIDNLIIASTLGAGLIPNYQAVAKIVSIYCNCP